MFNTHNKELTNFYKLINQLFMKKILLSILCLVAMAVTGYATEATVTVADLGYANQADLTAISVDENVTITFAQGSNSSNAPKYYDSGKAARCYAGNTITFSCAAGNMTKIVFNISNNGLKRLTDAIPSTGFSVVSAENKTITWTGDASEVIFTVGETADYGTEAGKPGQIHFASVVQLPLLPSPLSLSMVVLSTSPLR